jgi:phosphomannomutase
MSDISHIFKAYDVRGKVKTELNAALVKDIGRAFADWLPTDGPIAVGRDMRPDSEKLALALIDGVLIQGRDVIDLGLVTSDMSYFAVGKYNLAGAAMITASHNSAADNGIKLYRDKVTAVGLDSGLDKIRDRALGKSFKPSLKAGQKTTKDITEDWLAHVLSFVPDPKKIKPFNIAVDAGNGMAGKIFPEIEPYLPLHVTEMFFDLDPSFPNHEANPQKPETMKQLMEVVTKNNLDFGVAFDADGDRAGFVDDKGRPVLGTDMLSIVAKFYLEKYPGSDIIHEVRTSRATQELIKEWGGNPIRVKAGRIEIGRKLRELKAPFGGETTGHFFFKENYDADAALITLLVAIQAISDSGKKLSELVDEYRRYAIITETNFEVADPKAILRTLRSAFKDGQQDDVDGLTVNYPNSWFNVRVSNTEPVIRLNAEAKNQKQLDKLVSRVVDKIKS